MKAKITTKEFAALVARGGIIYFERARLCVMRVRDPATAVSVRKFIMEGPSGRHELACDMTSIDRLNAHWVPFAKHASNRY